jgi:hypothetical protein
VRRCRPGRQRVAARCDGRLTWCCRM